MKKIFLFTIVLLFTAVSFAQEIDVDDRVNITQSNKPFIGVYAFGYQGSPSPGYPQFQLNNYGGVPGAVAATADNSVLGMFQFSGHDGNAKKTVGVLRVRSMDNFASQQNARMDFQLGATRQLRMTILGANGNVGIGTETPQSKLHVKGDNLSAGIMRLEGPQSNAYALWFVDDVYTGYLGSYNGASDMDFGTGDSNSTGKTHLVTQAIPRLTVAADGNIGIGTTDPGINRLLVTTDGTNAISATSSNPGGTFFNLDNSSADGESWNLISTGATNSEGAGKLAFQTFAGASPGTKMTIQVDGNVGIGTPNPGVRLDVVGDGSGDVATFSSGGSTTNKVNFNSNSGYLGYIGSSVVAGDLELGTGGTSSNAINLNTQNVTRLKVTADGKVGIGMTDPNDALDIETDGATTNSAIDAKVNYVGSVDIRGIDINNEPGEGFGYGVYGTAGYMGLYGQSNGGAYSGSTYGVYGLASGTAGNRYSVYGAGVTGTGSTEYAGYFAGNVTVTGTFNNPSDARLKKNVKDYENALEIISQLDAKTYEFKNNEYEQMGLPQGPQIGFIAQELEKVLPSLVKENVHPEVVEHDEEGNRTVVKEAVSYKGVDYRALIPVLTAGIKELNGEVEAKDETIEELQSQLDAMSKKMEQMSELISDMNDKFNQVEEDMSQYFIGNEDSRMGTTNVELNGNDIAALEQNMPNPFHENTTIKYYIPSSSQRAMMTITDIKGSPLKSVNLEGTGLGTVTINANELPVGTYIYTLFVDGRQIASKQMILVK